MSPLLALCGLFAGCTWITDADVSARAGQVDDDGDGVPFSKDCNDGDPAISTSEPEIWYDGTDSDCKGDDDYDQDADGYVPTDFLGLTTKGVPGSGRLVGGDCDDADPLVSPKQPDDWYDGVDTACDGGDDYDRDGDGYVPDEYKELPTRYVGTSGQLPPGDCDDENAAVNPGVADVAYDGFDSDCGGEDDYDQDGDGFVPDEYYEFATTYVTGSGGLPSGDCNDEDASFRPDVDETWYTGFDEACDGGDDYDQDGDGYVRDVDDGKPTDGVEGSGELPAGDCDDRNGAAAPYANERLGDTTDQDCDGDNDSLQVRPITGYSWVGPRSPVMVDLDGRVYLSMAVSQVAGPTNTWFESGYALTWNQGEVANDPALITELAWQGNSTSPPYDVGAGHVFEVHNGELYGALGLSTSSARSFYVVRYDPSSGVVGSCLSQSSVTNDALEDLDLHVDDSSGVVFAVGCDGGADGVLSYVRVGALSGTTSAEAQEHLDDGTGSANVCGFYDDGSSLDIYARHSLDLWRYTFDSESPSPTITGASSGDGIDPYDLDFESDDVYAIAVPGLHAVYVQGAGIDAYVGQLDDSPQNAAVAALPNGQYLVGWVNDDGSVRIAFGSEAAGLSYYDVTYDGVADSVAVWGDDESAVVAVTGANAVAVGVYDLL